MPQITNDGTAAGDRAFAMTRVATALLRGLGGTRVSLRVAPPPAGDTNSQLGLAAQACEDVQLSPAVVRPQKPTADGRACIRVSLSSRTVQCAAEAHGFDGAVTWLLLSQGVLYRGKLMHVDSVLAQHFAGSEYLLHILASE